MHVCIHVTWYTCVEGQRTIFRISFSSYTIQILEIELRLSGFVGIPLQPESSQWRGQGTISNTVTSAAFLSTPQADLKCTPVILPLFFECFT